MLSTIRIGIIATLVILPFWLLAQKEISGSVEVKPVSNVIKLDGHQVFYNLPMNIIAVKLSITKIAMYRGPYADFASKLLNVNSGFIMADGFEFSLDGASLTRYSITDTSSRYAIQYSGWENLPTLQLNADGTILGYNVKNSVTQNCYLPQMNLNAPADEDFSFFDLGTRSFLEEEKETLTETSDSTVTKKVHNKQGLTPKTPEETAADAANFIRKIRKRRLKLLASMYQEANAVDGDALRIMVAELDELEKSYVELFVGKTIKTSYETTLLLTPSKGNENEQITLGWFSKSQGLVIQKQELRRNDSKPIIAKIEPQIGFPKFIVQTTDNSAKNPTAIRYGLYYRMPALTDITIECPETLNIRQQMQIAQKGVVVPIPSEYLLGRKFSIEFDGETGAIRQIQALDDTKTTND